MARDQPSVTSFKASAIQRLASRSAPDRLSPLRPERAPWREGSGSTPCTFGGGQRAALQLPPHVCHAANGGAQWPFAINVVSVVRPQNVGRHQHRRCTRSASLRTPIVTISTARLLSETQGLRIVRTQGGKCGYRTLPDPVDRPSFRRPVVAVTVSQFGDALAVSRRCFEHAQPDSSDFRSRDSARRVDAQSM